jgi:chromosome segregation ATPase
MTKSNLEQWPEEDAAVTSISGIPPCHPTTKDSPGSLNNALTYDELYAKFNDLREKFKRKEKDLVLAAEYGHSLLRKANELEAENKNLLNIMNEPLDRRGPQKNKMDSDMGRTIQELERQNNELREEVDSLQSEKLLSEKSADKRLKVLTENANGTKAELDKALSRIEELEAANHRLTLEKMEQKKNDTAKIEEDLIKTSEELELSTSRCQSLEATVAHLQQKNQNLQESAKSLQERCELLEEKVQEMDELRTSYESQQRELNEMTQAMQGAQEYIEALNSQLAMYEEKCGENLPEKVGKSLLTEVEDRRQELEEMHASLKKKHSGLVKVHTLTVYQKERMKNHITRLNQLSHTESDMYRIRQLERAVAQTRGENMELLSRINILEKGEEEYRKSNYIAVSSACSGNDSDIVNCLQLHIDKQAEEIRTLKKQARTSQMLRLSETERVRECELKILDKQVECEKLNSELAQIKFEYEDFKLKANLMQEYSFDILHEIKESANATNTGSVKTAEALKKSKQQGTQTCQEDVPTVSSEDEDISEQVPPDIQHVEETINIASPETRDTSESVKYPPSAPESVSEPHTDFVAATPKLEETTTPQQPEQHPPTRAHPKKIYVQKDKQASECNQQ